MANETETDQKICIILSIDIIAAAVAVAVAVEPTTAVPLCVPCIGLPENNAKERTKSSNGVCERCVNETTAKQQQQQQRYCAVLK